MMVFHNNQYLRLLEKKENNMINMGASIKKCTCEHVFQDRVYGNGRRVHTIGKDHTTCTVCGTIKR